MKHVEVGPQSTGLIMFIAHRFPNPLPNESIVTEVSSVPILGKTLGELQDWAVKLNGGNWSSDGVAQLWIREDVHVSHQAVGLFLETAKDVTSPAAALFSSLIIQLVRVLFDL